MYLIAGRALITVCGWTWVSGWTVRYASGPVGFSGRRNLSLGCQCAFDGLYTGRQARGGATMLVSQHKMEWNVSARILKSCLFLHFLCCSLDHQVVSSSWSLSPHFSSYIISQAKLIICISLIDTEQ